MRGKVSGKSEEVGEEGAEVDYSDRDVMCAWVLVRKVHPASADYT